MSDLLTLVAYKPDSFCVCMGQITDTYGSDFQLQHCITLESLANKVADLKEYKYGDQESPYEVHILINGRDLTSSNYPSVLEALETRVEAILAEREEARQKKAAQDEIDRVARLEIEQAEAAAAQQGKDLDQFFALGKKLGIAIPATAEHVA